MITRRIAIPLAFAILLCSAVGMAQALEIYTDRGQWEAAVGLDVLVEDLESETIGTFGTPYQTQDGFGIETAGMPIIVQVRNAGVVNGSREFLLKDMGNGALFNTPGIRRQLALGFDWATGLEGWQLQIGMQTVPLPGGSGGFVGVIDATGVLAGFKLTSPAMIQDGLAIDDISYTPSILVFTNRAEWASRLNGSVTVEDFESETVGLHGTPFTTVGGCAMQSGGAPFNVEVIASGNVDGTQELRVADYGKQLLIAFPGAGAREAIGFDWQTPLQTWSVYVREDYVSLTGMSSGFLGIIDQTGLVDSFTLTCAAVTQSGMRVDNLTFSSDVVPARSTTWGRIKALYE